MDYLLGRTWNNQIGYIPDDVKNTIKMILELNEKELDRVNAYLSAQIDSRYES